jgi:hypothetical protein
MSISIAIFIACLLPGIAELAGKRRPAAVVSAMDSMRDRVLSSQDVANFEAALFEWFVNRGLALELAVDKDLQTILAKLNSTYPPQSKLTRGRSRREFLPNLTLKMNVLVRPLLEEADSICLLSDGWTSIRRRHMLNVVVTTPTPIFLECIYTEEAKVDAQYQAAALVESLARHNVTPHAFCTDHASVMKKTWRLLEARFPHLLTYGCGAHAFQSLGKTISQDQAYSATLGTVNEIVVYFRRHTQFNGLAALRAKQRRLGKERELVQPNATRWHSHHDAVCSLIKSRDALTLLVNSQQWNGPELSAQQGVIRNSVNDCSFWYRLEEFQALCEPLKIAIKMIESDKAVLSEFFACILVLDTKLQSSTFARAALLARAQKSVREVHIAAFVLDPRFAPYVAIPELEQTLILRRAYETAFGSADAPEQESTTDVTATGSSLCQEIISYISAAQDHGDSASSRSPWRLMNPQSVSAMQWWTLFRSRFPFLCKLAKHILMFPPSSAAAERVWSAAGHIVSPIRSSLLPQTAEQLLFCYFNSKIVLPTDSSSSQADRWKFLQMAHNNSDFQATFSCTGSRVSW